MNILRIVSVSGGKDSTALYCWAIEQFGKEGFKAVFADTGHEHPVTYNYLRNLPEMADGPPIAWVKADFTEKVKAKNKVPSGNPFLDLMLWKGRAPSTKAQFCTEHLKIYPIKSWVDSIRQDAEIEMYLGIRAAESAARAKQPESEFSPLYDGYIKRPLLHWAENDIFAYLKKYGIPPNPLYEAGYKRVGCFPCIHANKTALSLLPEWAWGKIDAWEKRVGRTWFPFGLLPLTDTQKAELAHLRFNFGISSATKETDYSKEAYAALQAWKRQNCPSIEAVRQWSHTSRGGKHPLPQADNNDVPTCMSTWGICE